MKKTIIITMVLLALAAGFGFARGTREEETTEQAVPFPRWDEAELVTVTGTLVLEEDGFPRIVSGDEEYTLMYPRMMHDEIDVENGMEITVEGFLGPGPGWNEAEDEEFLRITKAVIDGEEYVVPYGHMAGGPRGRFGGPRGHWDGCCNGEYDQRGYGPMKGQYGGPGRGQVPGRGRW